MPELTSPLKIRLYKSKSLNPKQRWRWSLISANGRKIATSGEGYVNRVDALEMAEYIVKEGHLNAEVE